MAEEAIFRAKLFQKADEVLIFALIVKDQKVAWLFRLPNLGDEVLEVLPVETGLLRIHAATPEQNDRFVVVLRVKLLQHLQVVLHVIPPELDFYLSLTIYFFMKFIQAYLLCSWFQFVLRLKQGMHLQQKIFLNTSVLVNKYTVLLAKTDFYALTKDFLLIICIVFAHDFNFLYYLI